LLDWPDPLPDAGFLVLRHLAWLHEGGLVQTRREAQTVYYSLADERVRDMLSLPKQQFCH
jgi:hypothetical protein